MQNVWGIDVRKIKKYSTENEGVIFALLVFFFSEKRRIHCFILSLAWTSVSLIVYYYNDIYSTLFFLLALPLIFLVAIVARLFVLNSKKEIEFNEIQICLNGKKHLLSDIYRIHLTQNKHVIIMFSRNDRELKKSIEIYNDDTAEIKVLIDTISKDRKDRLYIYNDIVDSQFWLPKKHLV